MKYKVTKLKVREDAKNGKSNLDLKEENILRVLTMLGLGFTGGTVHVEEGDSYTGELTSELKPGNSITIVDTNTWFKSSPVEQVEESDGVFNVRTKNSFYKVEPIND